MAVLRIGVVTIGDERKEFYQTRIKIVEEENAKLEGVLSQKYDAIFTDIIYSSGQLNECMDDLRRQGADCVIIHLPIWGTPSLAAQAAQMTEFPVALLGNRRQNSSSIVTLLAVAGMLDQIGKDYIRIAGDIAEETVKKQLFDFLCACEVVWKLKRSRFCSLGGSSIGIGTTNMDALQWKSIFGINYDHCDQLELVQRAKSVDAEKVLYYMKWLEESAGSIQFSGRFTPDSLEKQVRSYLALKELVEEKKYDFLGLKCQTELSDGYVLQCLGVGLMNGNLDAEGPKCPIPVACECDCDGALTMYLLSLCAGQMPASLMDIKYFSEKTGEFVLANCGSMAPYFAASGDSCKGMKQINLLPHVFGKAGGAALQFVASPGKTTVARLCRKKGEYTLYCFEGETTAQELERLKETTWCYPHQFIRADIDYEYFFQTIGSNHLHTIYGQYKEVLRQICKILKIKFVCYNF